MHQPPQPSRRFAFALFVALFVSVFSLTSLAQAPAKQAVTLSKTDFEIIEGRFHDGLGTFAELTLANELIALAHLSQAPFDATRSRTKMQDAIAALPAAHPQRAVFAQEIRNIEQAAKQGAIELLHNAGAAALRRVRHTARDFANARAGDLVLEFADRAPLPVSVKTDKSGRVAVAEGQTPDLGAKWAERYFNVSAAELDEMIAELGFASLAAARAYYLNIARLVAAVLMRRLELTDCEPTDFSRARVGNLKAAQHLFRQLRHYKHGNDDSRVIIFDRSTGKVSWESLLEEIEIETLSAERISFTPARPRTGRAIATTFGVRIDGRTVVTFQIKHKRGKARGTSLQYEFSDITTRLETR